jgi:MFS family permease
MAPMPSLASFVPARYHAHCTVAGGFLLHLTLGTLYSIGNLNPYWASYMRAVHCGEAYDTCESAGGVTNTEMVWVLNAATATQACTMFVGGGLQHRIGPRQTALLGGLIASAGVALSFIPLRNGSFVGLVLTAGVLFGVGVGIAYTPPMVLAMKWWPRQKGLINGIVVGGFGLGALIFDNVQTLYVNGADAKPTPGLYPLVDPAQKYFTMAQVARTPSLMLLLGAVYSALQLIGVSLLVVPPAELQGGARGGGGAGGDPESKQALMDRGGGGGEDDDRDDSAGGAAAVNPHPALLSKSSSSSSSSSSSGGSDDLTTREMIRQPRFWVLWGSFALNAFAISFTAGLFKVYGEDRLISDSFLGSVVGPLSSLFNAGARVFWGRMEDRYGFSRCMLAMQLLMAALMATWTLTDNVAPGHFPGAAHTGATANKVLYLVWVCLIFFCIGGNFSLFPTATTKAFGMSHAGANYGAVFTSLVPSNIIGGFITKPLKDALGWGKTSLVIAGLSLIGGLLGASFDRVGKKSM